MGTLITRILGLLGIASRPFTRLSRLIWQARYALGILLIVLFVSEWMGGNKLTRPTSMLEKVGGLFSAYAAESATDEHTNRLANEKSPYLLQHAHNPVDWYPWGEEAFAKARKENKPIFLSVGYSTCHWCHVMEHESFERSGDRGAHERAFREHQSRSRGAAGRGSRLYDLRAGDDGRRRLADERLPHARPQAVLWRHVFPARRTRTAAPGFSLCSSASRKPGRTRNRKSVPRPRRSPTQLQKFAGARTSPNADLSARFSRTA